MPQLEGGDIESVTNKANQTSKKLKDYIDDGYKFFQLFRLVL